MFHRISTNNIITACSQYRPTRTFFVLFFTKICIFIDTELRIFTIHCRALHFVKVLLMLVWFDLILRSTCSAIFILVSTAKPRCGRVSPVSQNRFQFYKWIPQIHWNGSETGFGFDKWIMPLINCNCVFVLFFLFDSTFVVNKTMYRPMCKKGNFQDIILAKLSMYFFEKQLFNEITRCI